MTQYRIVHVKCPDSSVYYVEYKGWFLWHRAGYVTLGIPFEFHFATLEEARACVAKQQAYEAPCVTTIYPA